MEKKGYVREDDVKRLFADVGADWDAAADRFGLNGASDRVSADSFRAVMRWAWSDLKEGVTWAATKVQYKPYPSPYTLHPGPFNLEPKP